MAAKKYLSLERLTEYDALIKSYADSAATTVKNDLLNGAGDAYDTLKELGDLITENTNALDVLETVATGKADADHTHEGQYLTEIPAEYITETELSAKGYITSIPEEYVTETELTDKGYATVVYVDEIVGDIETLLAEI